MQCIRCDSGRTRRDGQTRLGGQRWRCNDCRRRFTARSASAFSGRGSADEVIALAVRWYVRYRLSYADVAEWLADRGLSSALSISIGAQAANARVSVKRSKRARGISMTSSEGGDVE